MGDVDWMPPRSIDQARLWIDGIAESITLQMRIVCDEQRPDGEVRQAAHTVILLTAEQSRLLRWIREYAAK